MANVRDLFSLEEEERAFDEGLITKRPHPYLNYSILCYSRKAPYTEGAWDNPAVYYSRGLILDDRGEIIARPWAKFFNYGQAEASKIALNDPVVVMDKVDSSLSILYPTPFGHGLSSKASFTSDQAKHATSLWDKYYAHLQPNPEFTFLFEVVYRANKIVVDYGDMDDLVLLGAVHIETGEVYPSDTASTFLGWTGPIAEVFNYSTLREALEAPPRNNAEGFVILDVVNQSMVKWKYEDYLIAHRLVSNLTPRTIWEQLLSKTPEEEIVGIYPDEFQEEAEQYIREIKSAFSDLAFEVAMVYDSIKHIESQKDFAQEALKYSFSAELFLTRQGKDAFESLMKKIRPEAVDKS